MKEEKEIQFKYDYLRGFIKTHFKTIANFAGFLGISVTTLNDRLRGNTSFTQLEIYKTANFATNRKLTAREVELLFFNY